MRTAQSLARARVGARQGGAGRDDPRPPPARRRRHRSAPRADRERSSSPSQVIVVTAYADVDNAVEALQAGAVDYLTKPLQVTDLIIKLRKVLEARGLRDRLALAKSDVAAAADRAPKSAAARDVRTSSSRSPQSPFTPGVPRRPLGRRQAVRRRDAAPHDVRRPARRRALRRGQLRRAPGHLVESELFGHERGAFTDAKTTRRGLIEMADGGTLFLDEITELPEPSQAKLLKFLDSMRFRRLGGQREIEVSLRVVAATNQDVPKLDPRPLPRGPLPPPRGLPRQHPLARRSAARTSPSSPSRSSATSRGG